MKTGNVSLIDRTYELVKWFLNHLAKFPRSQRYGLGQRIEDRLYGVLEGLVEAQYSPAQRKRERLLRVNLDLEILRMLTRLAHELTLLPHKSHEYAAEEMNEIGKMVGGWLRQQSQTNRSSRG